MVVDQNSLRTSLNSLLSVRAAPGKDGQPRDHRRALGRYGEQIALKHLRALGFSLLARNYRTRRGEIDLIVFDGSTLLFVEVKTQQMGVYQRRMSLAPLQWVSASQLKRYRPVALAWLNDRRHRRPAAQNTRFDAIGVIIDARGALLALDHIEGGL